MVCNTYQFERQFLPNGLYYIPIIQGALDRENFFVLTANLWLDEILCLLRYKLSKLGKKLRPLLGHTLRSYNTETLSNYSKLMIAEGTPPFL